MDDQFNPQNPFQEQPEHSDSLNESSGQEGSEEALPKESGDAAGTESGKPYQSSYDAYRFRNPDEEEAGKKPVYDQNQYGQRQDQPGYGYDQRGQNGYTNYSDPVRTSHPMNQNGSNRPHRDHSLRNGIILAVVFGTVAAIVFFLLSQVAIPRAGRATTSSDSERTESGITLGRQDEETETEPELIAPSEAGEEPAKELNALTIPQVTKKVMPSMVAITNTTVQQYQTFFGETYDRESVSAGSGIIVGETDEHLLIATNNHVISGSSDITVTFVDDSAIAGTVQGTDADNDLAIVSVSKKDIPENTMKAIAIVEIGDSDAIEVGDQVVAIGNALGYGQSVSAGIVSAKGREMKSSDGTTRTVIQTDASINPGNSGGALLNMDGKLIGINEAKLVNTSIEGVGYAIPMSIAEPILTNLGNKTSRTRVDQSQASYLGITCVTMPDQYTSSGYPQGVYVASVVSGGPAEKAGIQKGDIITSFDGSSVTTKEELLSELEYYAAGESVPVSVSRMNRKQDGFEKKQLTVTLGKRSESEAMNGNDRSGQSDQSRDTEEFDSRNGYFGKSGSLFDLFQ